MDYQITHVTTYESSEPVTVCHNQAWLTPRNCPSQTCRSHQIIITPEPSTFHQRQDAFGNTLTHFSFNEGYETLEVKALSDVSISARTAPAPIESPPWEEVVLNLKTAANVESLEAFEFCFDSPRVRTGPELLDYAQPDFPEGRPIVEAVAALNSRIHAEFEHDPKATTVTTPATEVLARRRGVCQDFAHLQIGMLRSLGLAARYVSGYVRTHPPSGRPRLVGADASHAWVSVYCGPLGWIDVDPTNDSFPGVEHITVAWGRDYSDVSPLRGVYTGGGRHNLKVAVDVGATG